MDFFCSPQRSALSLANGTVYVAFSGHAGDCGNYRGWVVAVSASNPRQVAAWHTRALGGGIWAPGGMSFDGRDLFVTTGNTFSTAVFLDGEMVLRIRGTAVSPTRNQDFFAPTNWNFLDLTDLDLGGTGPVPIELPGSTPSHLLLQFGKDGHAYLLDRTNLGGIGGMVEDRLVSSSVHTAPAVYRTSTTTYVAFHAVGHGCPMDGMTYDLTVLKMVPGTPPSSTLAWCAPENGNAGPIVTMVDATGRDSIVWIIGTERDNLVRMYNGETGARMLTGPWPRLSTVQHFQSAIAANGRIYVAANDRLWALTVR